MPAFAGTSFYILKNNKKYLGFMRISSLIILAISFAIISTLQVFGSPQPDYKDSVVAHFAGYTISLDEFRTAYLDVVKRPNVFDSKELREKFLDELIATKLMAAEAKKTGLHTDTLFNFKVDAYGSKCLREAHYDAVIRPAIKVDDKEIEDAYQFTQEERNLSHLFYKTKEEADSAYKLLLTGANFEELAKSVFADSLLKNNGGNLGWVNWEQLDYEIADAAFKLLPDVFSKPVKSQYGYHILKVLDFRKKPLITNWEYQVQKQKTKYLVEFKKGQQISYEYISGLLKNAKITLYPKVAQYLQKKLAEQFKRKPDAKNAGMEFQLSEEEINRVEASLWDSKNEVVATVNGSSLTVGWFLSNLNYIPYEISYSDFDRTLDYSIRDYLLTNEAKNMGLEKNEKVLMKTNLYSEYFLKLGLGRRLVAGVEVDEYEIKNYYNEHRKSFKDAKYEDCRPVINELIMKNKKSAVIPLFVKSIEKNMTINKYTEVIHRYYDKVLKGSVDR